MVEKIGRYFQGFAMLDRRVGFITGGSAAAGSWREHLLEQYQRLKNTGRSSVVVMVDTLPSPDLELIGLLVDFRIRVRSEGGECTFVALHERTIAGLRACAGQWDLPFIDRIEDLPRTY